jgi:ABC-type uncharacterized transport system ATPase subunit
VQKVLLGRKSLKSNVLLVAYPVRGLDINSSYTIYNLLNEQKKKDVAILFIGEDLDVLLELCDRSWSSAAVRSAESWTPKKPQRKSSAHDGSSRPGKRR